jgi:hypothetical protein
MNIDITFDMNSDARGGDPDTYSTTLRSYHQQLWSKELPRGTKFEIKHMGRYLGHASDLGTFYLGSDAITHSYRNHTRKSEVLEQIPDEVHALFAAGSTIGAYTLFPNNRIEMKPTINGYRGMNGSIDDRFDLTLECIRRHYAMKEGSAATPRETKSPLSKVLMRYADFFDLFESFEGYVQFFFLQDLLKSNGSVKFYLPFDDFETRPGFRSIDDYHRYKDGVLAFIGGRNARIEIWSGMAS